MKVIVDGRLGDLSYKRSHRDFDVEFYHVGYGVELNVDDLVLERHEAD